MTADTEPRSGTPGTKHAKTFHVEWGGEETLSVDEIWPDGNAPENPTVADVIAEMQKCGSISRLCQDWNLRTEGVEVDGKDSGLR